MYMKLDVVIVDGRANEEMMQQNRYGLLRKPLRQRGYHDQNIGNSFWSTLWLGWQCLSGQPLRKPNKVFFFFFFFWVGFFSRPDDMKIMCLDFRCFYCSTHDHPKATTWHQVTVMSALTMSVYHFVSRVPGVVRDIMALEDQTPKAQPIIDPCTCKKGKLIIGLAQGLLVNKPNKPYIEIIINMSSIVLMYSSRVFTYGCGPLGQTTFKLASIFLFSLFNSFPLNFNMEEKKKVLLFWLVLLSQLENLL